MSLFKKKSSNEEVPEIPSIPELPSFSLNAPKPSADLPATTGDARDVDNQEAIKLAIDSSEKISGDSGAVTSPSESLPIPPVSTPLKNMSFSSLPSAPQPAVKPLPEVPKYENRQPVFASPLPPLTPKEPLPAMNFIKPEPTEMQETTFKIEEKTVKRDASDSIFVRIDKFNSAKRDVSEIGRDLREITGVIEKINDIKLKEDEEIMEINKTLEEIKNRINRIDLEVFNRV